MHILSIHNKGQLHKNKKSHVSKKNVVDEMIQKKKHVFILIYMEGCGPCNATRPEWSKMAHTLNSQYANNDDIVIIDLNKDLLPEVKNVGSVNGFPTMKYITNKGNTTENYEDSGVKKKDRSADSFINWVESKVLNGRIISTGFLPSSPEHVYKRLTQPKDKKGKGIRVTRQTKQGKKVTQNKRTRKNKSKRR
jgi:thiol-disulfide isomerase/thioredoxin